MQDTKISKSELLHDTIFKSIELLYEAKHRPFFDLLIDSLNNISNGEILTDFEDSSYVDKLNEIYAPIMDVDFNVEDIRLALQALLLRGFKEQFIPNGNTTPDSIGMLYTYLIDKMTKADSLTIFDPFAGSGNLLFTISNYLNKDLKLIASDNDELMAKLLSAFADVLRCELEIYFQDCLTLNFKNVDSIVFDMPYIEGGADYKAYEYILHFKDMLKEDGFMIGLLGNDFFDYDKDKTFKEALLSDSSIVGIIELPDEMFKSIKPKIILIIKKKKIDNLKCFMVKLPSFKDVKAFNDSLIDVEAWFEKNKI